MDDIQNHQHTSLAAIPANRALVDSLYTHQQISTEARNYALDLLYPAKQWGLWTARLLTLVGTALVLSGILYFFAFNWAKITPAMKLGGIQLLILACLIGALYYGLARTAGKMLLLSASVLVGIFLAVFGQIYQTGADAYQLFMVWMLLILPWTCISNFAALWAVWLLVSNLALILYWDQAATPKADLKELIFSYLILFNGFFLALREYFAYKGVAWLQRQWTRIILVIPILIFALIPTIEFIMDTTPSSAVTLGTVLAIVVHCVFYLHYRFRNPNIPALSLTILSAGLIAEVIVNKMIDKLFPRYDAGAFLLMALFTLGIFALIIIILRSHIQRMQEEAKHV